MCQYGSCSLSVESGEGVRVTGAGYKMVFCSWDHAAKWTLAFADRMESPKTGKYTRALYALGENEIRVRLIQPAAYGQLPEWEADYPDNPHIKPVRFGANDRGDGNLQQIARKKLEAK
jgi:hypothetical protein